MQMCALKIVVRRALPGCVRSLGAVESACRGSVTTTLSLGATATVAWVAPWANTPRVPQAWLAAVLVELVRKALDRLPVSVPENIALAARFLPGLFRRLKRHTIGCAATLNAALAGETVSVAACDMREVASSARDSLAFAVRRLFDVLGVLKGIQLLLLLDLLVVALDLRRTPDRWAQEPRLCSEKLCKRVLGGLQNAQRRSREIDARIENPIGVCLTFVTASSLEKGGQVVCRRTHRKEGCLG